MHMQKSVFTHLILGSSVHNYFSLSSAQAHRRLSTTAVQEPSSLPPHPYPLYLPPQLKANYSPQIRNTISSVILLWTATAKEITFLLKLIKDKLSAILGGLRIFLRPLFLLCSVIFPSLSCLIFNCQLSSVLARWQWHLCWHEVYENERIGPTRAGVCSCSCHKRTLASCLISWSGLLCLSFWLGFSSCVNIQQSTCWLSALTHLFHVYTTSAISVIDQTMQIH